MRSHAESASVADVATAYEVGTAAVDLSADLRDFSATLAAFGVGCDDGSEASLLTPAALTLANQCAQLAARLGDLGRELREDTPVMPPSPRALRDSRPRLRPVAPGVRDD